MINTFALKGLHNNETLHHKSQSNSEKAIINRGEKCQNKNDKICYYAAMEDALLKLGLNDKEIRLYSLILDRPGITAAELAKASGEQRTNVYALLDSLLEAGIVLTEDDAPVKQFKVAEPSALRKLLDRQQDELRQADAALRGILPRIKAQYSLSNDKPGVIHMAGMDGLLRLLDDMVYSQTDVLLVASDLADVELLRGFKDRLLARKSRGVKTRAIAHDANRSDRQAIYAERGMELRFLGELPYTGEVVIYEDNVAFTVYEPSIVTTVVTNHAIAETMRRMFDSLWQQADA